MNTPGNSSAGPYAIGIDVGGTRLKCGAVSLKGELLANSVNPSQASVGVTKLVPAIKREVAKLREQLGEPIGVGLGLTGVVDPEQGVVYLPGKFKGLEGFPIVPKLETALELPVMAGNDGQLSMLAEQRFGAARKTRWAVTITLGTGVGSGVLLDGQLIRDPSFLFGTQLGHCVLQNYGGKLCLTTAHGTGETLCSCTALALSVRDGLQRGIPSALTDRYWQDAHRIDFQTVIDGVRDGDPLCVEEFDRWVNNLGCLVATAVHAYAPQKIIFGGGGVHAADLFLPRLRRYINQHTFRYPADRKIKLETSPLGDQVGFMGAAALMMENPR